MKVAAMALAVLGAVFALSGAHAQTRPGFAIGPEAAWYYYKESGVSLAGPMAGVQGSYTWIPGPVFLRLEAAGDFIYVDYSSTVSGNNNSLNDLKGEGRALAGSDFTLRPGLVLTPYGGVGYRILYDMEGGTTTNRVPAAVGYNRLSQYLYLPLGVTLGIAAGDWIIKPNVEFDYLVQGWQTSYIRNVGFDSDLSNVQTKGYGLRGQVTLETDTRWGRLSIGPYTRFWKIDQSNSASLFAHGRLVGVGFEPSNHTFETGASIVLHF